MNFRRFLAPMMALALFAGCSQEKKADLPAVGQSQGPKPADPAKADDKKLTADPVKADGKKPTADELMAKAQQALAKEDADTAIAALEELVAAEPKNRDALFLLSRVLLMKGLLASEGGNLVAGSEPILKSARYIKQLRTSFPNLTEQESRELPIFLYNEACALALKGESDKAMAALEDACNSGFSDLSKLNDDKALDKLRSQPRFKTFLESVAVKLAARAKEHAHGLIAAQKPFEFNFSLPDLDGKKVSLQDFAGKILIADIWGTWCPPCREEIPHFIELVKKYEDKGLRMVGINYENGTPAEARKIIREFVLANKMNYPCLLGDDKTRDQVPHFEGYPTTLFIDRAGKVRLCVVGYHSKSDLEAIIQELIEDKTASVK
jgi:thiol-disulfide isomerase/thioredoxin